MTFDEAFDVLLRFEGGYSDHAADPGGRTRYGITEAVARAHGYGGDMRDLPLDVAKVIYRTDYWQAVRADDLPEALRYAVFDGAVNSGVGQSVRWLQRAAGVADDGVIGPVTLAAVRAGNAGHIKSQMIGERLRFLANLSTWGSFGRGWSRRVADVLMLP